MILCSDIMIIGDGETVLSNGALRISEDGLLEKIGPKEKICQAYPKESVRDYGASSILPGLIDSHVHLGYYYSQPDAYDYDDFSTAFYTLQQGKEALQKGITTVRDLSSPHKLCQRLREAEQKGYFLLPRILHADTGMCMTGGHGHDDGIPEIDGIDAIRKEIRQELRDGADWIKILTSNRQNVPEYTQKELDAAVEESHRLHTKCAVHAGLQPAIQMAIDAGFDTIEHGTFLTYDQAMQMTAHSQAWTPTMTAYTVLYEKCIQTEKEIKKTDNRILAKSLKEFDFFEKSYYAYKNNFKKIYDTGITVLAGTDMVLNDAPPFPLARELTLMVEYGITPLQAIQTATMNPAKILNLEHITGKLQEGLEADLLVVPGDASKDINALHHVIQVYKKGVSVLPA